jgi:malic enzyme
VQVVDGTVSSGALSNAWEPAGDQQVEPSFRIVGAGPAGISVALELVVDGARVWLLDRSGKDMECRTQRLNRGQSVSDPTLTMVALALPLADHMMKQMAA